MDINHRQIITNLSTNFLHKLRCLLDRELNCIQIIYYSAHLLSLHEDKSSVGEKCIAE